MHLLIQFHFSLRFSTVSKILRQKKRFLYSGEQSQNPTKRAKSKFSDIERALRNWANNEQIKGEPPNDFKLQEQAKRFAVTVGDHESLSKFASSAWLEEFKENFLSAKDYCNSHELGGIHVVDSNTSSLPETPPPISSNQMHRSDALSHFTVKPSALVKLEGQDESTPRTPENTSSVSSGPPTQDDARRALILVLEYFRSQSVGFLEPDECAVVGKLTAKLFSSISKGTAVLPGWIDESLNPSIPKKRKVEAMNNRTSCERLTCSTGFAVDEGYSACGGIAAELVSHVY